MAKEKKIKEEKEISLLDEFIKEIDNEYAGIAEGGIVSGDITSFIDTGAYAFNAQVSGSIYDGIPDNKVLFLAGSESTGKCQPEDETLDVYMTSDTANALGVSGYFLE